MYKAAYLYQAQVVKIIDGDTFDAVVDLGFYVNTLVRFRMYGIDTAEVNDKDPAMRTLAMEAKLFCVDKLLNKSVTLQTYKTDKYGRWLAEAYLPNEEKSVNTQLLEANLAVPYPV